MKRADDVLAALLGDDQPGEAQFLEVRRERGGDFLRTGDLAADLAHRRAIDGADAAVVVEGRLGAALAQAEEEPPARRVAEGFARGDRVEVGIIRHFGNQRNIITKKSIIEE